jgi:hypothetical protein
MRLQYQLSNGSWTDCNSDGDDRTSEFLARCAQYGGGEEKALIDLEAGREVSTGGDWYSCCRDAEAVERILAERRANQVAVETVKCDCGHTVPRNLVMSASLGTACPECYDRLSD